MRRVKPSDMDDMLIYGLYRWYTDGGTYSHEEALMLIDDKYHKRIKRYAKKNKLPYKDIGDRPKVMSV